MRLTRDPLDRLHYMRRILSLLLVTLVVPVTTAQDVEFIRALERAQKDRPANLDSRARIAPETEPGTPLVIHGRVFREDGRTPVADAVVFAYHTDREGLYNRAGSPPHSWRLRGWARTDSEGRFEFRTIRPGAYPSRNQAAHVHFNVFTTEGRFHGGLEFDDDPLIGPADRARPNASGEFGTIRPVRREGATEHVDFRIRLNPRDRF
jgi:protocatechuate 3,4-dioxygenase beta subunit